MPSPGSAYYGIGKKAGQALITRMKTEDLATLGFLLPAENGDNAEVSLRPGFIKIWREGIFTVYFCNG